MPASLSPSFTRHTLNYKTNAIAGTPTSVPQRSSIMSSISAFTLAVLLFLLSSVLLSVQGCPPHELKALLRLKASLNDTEGKLKSWKPQNCCAWDGVKCSGIEKGRHVSKLDLKGFGLTSLRGEIDSSLFELKHLNYLDLLGNYFHGEIPFQLGKLSSLRHLHLESTHGCDYNLESHSLSCNMDHGLRSCNLHWLSNLSSLEYLSLNAVNVNDKSWGSTIGSLVRLKHLDLSWSSLPAPTIPAALRNLSSLTFLDLSFKSFSNLPTWIGELSSLTHLDLSYNGIRSIPNTVGNLTRLDHLDLSCNNLRSIPYTIGNLTGLEHLHLMFNTLTGILPLSFAHLSSLISLNVSYNHLNGSIPNTIGNLTRLEHLDLSYNDLTGSLPFSFAHLSSLISLDVSHNHLSGSILSSIGNLTSLDNLDLSYNTFTGSLPLSVTHLSSLIFLDVTNNHLNGSIPSRLMLPSALQELLLSNNNMNGTITEVFFQRSFKLKELYMSHCGLSINISSTWIPSFQLKYLYLRNCQIGGPIPSWISTQFSLEILDLSSTQLVGNLPSWLWNIENVQLSNNHLHGSFTPTSGSLRYLDLSTNELSGRLPADIQVHLPKAEALILADNKFEGQIQASIANLRNLIILDICNNRLTGDVPVSLGNLTDLQVLNLQNNVLEGEIPKELGRLSYLQSLRIGKNNLRGVLPSSLRNLSGLQVLDVAGSSLTGNIPNWIANFSNLQVLVMRCNNFTGNLLPEIGQMPNLQALDLSSNFFSGAIPLSYLRLPAMQNSSFEEGFLKIYPVSFGYTEISYRESLDLVVKGKESHCEYVLSSFASFDLSHNRLGGPLPPEIENLKGLIFLNLSRNSLNGPIPDSLGNLVQLESVDLSFNNFSGQIPSQLGNLTFLAHLNLSYNNLFGRIPHEQAQMVTFDLWSYIGNPNLWGCPLKRNCSHPIAWASPPPAVGVEEKREEGFEFLWYWVCFGLSVGVGFSGVVMVLVLKHNWRTKCFEVMDRFIEVVDRVICVLSKPKPVQC